MCSFTSPITISVHFIVSGEINGAEKKPFIDIFVKTDVACGQPIGVQVALFSAEYRAPSDINQHPAPVESDFPVGAFLKLFPIGFLFTPSSSSIFNLPSVLGLKLPASHKMPCFFPEVAIDITNPIGFDLLLNL